MRRMVALGGAVLLGMLGGGTAGAAPNAQQRAWLARAQRHDKAGWIYLHVEGGPEERGFQHGYLLAREIAECRRVFQIEWLHDSSMDWPWLIEHTKAFTLPAVDPENLAEIRGIVAGMRAAGVGTSVEEMVTYNAWIELTEYWWPLAQRALTEGVDVVAKPKDRCSAFIAVGRMTKDGGVVLGHNTMDVYTEAFTNLIIDIVPARGHRILMQAQPGWIHSGTDFFITDAGLVGTETTIDGFQHFSEKGIPEFARMRRATQDAATLDQWCAIMKAGNNGGYANAWLLGDINTREIARLELGLKYVGFERTKNGYYVGSNLAENLKIRRLETTYGDSDTDIRLSPVARRVRWKQLMTANAGKIDLALAEQMEADCNDTCLNRNHPSGRNLDAHNELDAEPAWGGDVPYSPQGTYDAKVVDATLARSMAFRARWGSADGTAFDASAFLAAHPQFDWMAGILRSRPAEPWVVFRAGETAAGPEATP